MTKGEKVIRPDFAKDERVKDIKTMYSVLYDVVDTIASWGGSTEKSAETNRLVQKALDDIEISAMYAVKALTL